jgi:hypothetical protein
VDAGCPGCADAGGVVAGGAVCASAAGQSSINNTATRAMGNPFRSNALVDDIEALP